MSRSNWLGDSRFLHTQFGPESGKASLILTFSHAWCFLCAVQNMSVYTLICVCGQRTDGQEMSIWHRSTCQAGIAGGNS